MSSTSSATDSICNLDQMYTERFNYYIPREELTSYFSGYTEEERKNLEADINEIWANQLKNAPECGTPCWISAGAPGSGKTVKLRQDLEESRIAFDHPYIDPNDVCLPQMSRTYQKDLAACDGSKEERKRIYDKWKSGSYAAAHTILATITRGSFMFYYGTQATAPSTINFFEFLKARGYHITLIHVTAPDDVRRESILKREGALAQISEEEIQADGLSLPQRILDTYLAFANQIKFYYRGTADQDAQLAATWTRYNKTAYRLRHSGKLFTCIQHTLQSKIFGELEVANKDLYGKVAAIHDAACERLQRPDLKWEHTVDAHSLHI